MTEKEELISQSGIYIEEQLSPNISVTPEGYIICENVAIARTGILKYAPGEMPGTPSVDGYIHITRSEQEVFDTIAMQSFEGKPVTIDHPSDFVDSTNWKEYAVGVTHNIRRSDDLLMADLLITDADAIKRITEKGLREISCGYTSRMDTGNQTMIRGNHIALVNNGRAGPICSIRDSKTEKEEIMSQKTSFKDSLKQFLGMVDSEAVKLIATYDAAPEEKEAVEDEEPEVEAMDSAVEARFSKIEDILAQLLDAKCKDADPVAELEATDSEDEPDGDEVKDSDEEIIEDSEDEPEDVKNEDSAELNRLVAQAEILVPGIKLEVSTKDSSGKTVVDLQKCKLQVLTEFLEVRDGRSIIGVVSGHKDINTLSADAIDIVFDNAVRAKATMNNKAFTSVSVVDAAPTVVHKTVQQKIEEINNLHKK